MTMEKDRTRSDALREAYLHAKSWIVFKVNNCAYVILGPGHTGPESLDVNACNLNRWEHGSWALPLHMGS